jgi:Skp family chaperone for outer membrane proteins
VDRQGEAADVVREALVDLAGALRGLAATTGETLTAMGADFSARIQAVADEETEARRELEACRNACDEDESDHSESDDELEAASERLRLMSEVLAQVEHEYAWLQRRREALNAMLAERVPNALAFLARKADHLGVYEGITLEGDSVSSLAARQCVVLHSADATTTLQPVACGLPKGFTWVKLDAIDLRDVQGVSSAADYRKVPYQQMCDGFERLKREILPALAESLTSMSDHFREIDRQSGLDYEHGLQRIYDAFFGHHDFVYFVRRQDGGLDLVNGRHRVKVAWDLGWDAIPARVKERHG